jgi:hypothetical protein
MRHTYIDLLTIFRLQNIVTLLRNGMIVEGALLPMTRFLTTLRLDKAALGA